MEDEPSEEATFTLPMEEGRDPLLSAMQYKYPPNESPMIVTVFFSVTITVSDVLVMLVTTVSVTSGVSLKGDGGGAADGLTVGVAMKVSVDVTTGTESANALVNPADTRSAVNDPEVMEVSNAVITPDELPFIIVTL